MRLFIAEKPSVAKAIAAELGVTGRGEGVIECGDSKVTWCVGHMLEQASPDEYTPDDVPRSKSGTKLWRVDDLPIIPKDWILRPKAEMKDQLKVIGKLVKEAKLVVNAGDPDREGQLLVDAVLEFYANKSPVQRYWVSANDPVSVQRGLNALKPNAEFSGFGAAAKARGRADWLIGMNLSRAFTLRAQRGGSRALLTVGRVQTPTLALVVSRDREIEAFKSQPFHTLTAKFNHSGGNFVAKWEAGEEQAGLDGEGRLTDTGIANDLVTALANKTSAIKEYSQEPSKKGHPRAYSLSDITLLASNKFGLTAEETLATCQSLYEKKLTSYPRTDNGFLPEVQHADAPQVLAALKVMCPELARVIDGADPSIKSKTWDDTQTTAHHGIIPTAFQGGTAGLSENEKGIYNLIVRTYLAQFYPIHEFLRTTVSIEVAGEKFKAAGNVVTRNGWCEVYGQADPDDESDQEDEGEQEIPAMKLGDEVVCSGVTRNDSKTKAPPRFTEGTLGRAMENIHKTVSDPAHKKMLRDGEGIGTPATRPSIMSELRRREYLAAKGKTIISTTLGRSLVDALPEAVRSPVLTAIYERMLLGIEKGTAEFSAFIDMQEKFIRDQVAKANVGSVSIAGGKEAAQVSQLYKCMACSHGLTRRDSTKKKGSFWWGCSNYPTCSQTYAEANGKPDYSRGNSGKTKE